MAPEGRVELQVEQQVEQRQQWEVGLERLMAQQVKPLGLRVLVQEPLGRQPLELELERQQLGLFWKRKGLISYLFFWAAGRRKFSCVNRLETHLQLQLERG